MVAFDQKASEIYRRTTRGTKGQKERNILVIFVRKDKELP